MTGKKTLLHIVDSLGRGGAETLLVGVIKSTPELEHIIISLKPYNEFGDELVDIKTYFLDLKWYHSIPRIVYQVKKIIFQHQIDIIHAHLFWSVIISRLTCPINVKLINSYHAVLYGVGKYPNYARLLDKLTYTAKVTTLCVSNEVKKNINEFVGIKSNVFVLYNFIDDAFYNNFRPVPKIKEPLKMVAVGNLKKDKNYEVIINAFSELDASLVHKVSLDIYGKGPLLDELKNNCLQKNIFNISLKGTVANVSAVLPKYDVFIISSTSEGFGLAVVEAMAVGLPVIVSDIPTLREVTGGYALFFNPLSATDLSEKIKAIVSGEVDLLTLAGSGYRYSERYTKRAYLEKLMAYYLN